MESVNPYEAPKAASSGRTPRGRYRFEDPTGRGRVAKALIWASVGMSLITTAFMFVWQPAINPSPQELKNVLAVLMLIGLLGMVVSVLTIVFYCMWTHRVASNAHALRGRGLTVSPGWCVGWFFIPILFWWMPCRGMLQIWRGSQSGAEEVRDSGPVTLWWTFWIAHQVVGYVNSFMTNFTADSAARHGQGIFGMLMIVSAVLYVGAGYGATAMISKLDEMQLETRARRQAETPPRPTS